MKLHNAFLLMKFFLNKHGFWQHNSGTLPLFSSTLIWILCPTTKYKGQLVDIPPKKSPRFFIEANIFPVNSVGTFWFVSLASHQKPYESSLCSGGDEIVVSWSVVTGPWILVIISQNPDNYGYLVNTHSQTSYLAFFFQTNPKWFSDPCSVATLDWQLEPLTRWIQIGTCLEIGDGCTLIIYT